MKKNADKVTFRYILLTAFAVLSSWVLHEFAHFSMGSFLGYEMTMNLNQAYPLTGAYGKEWDYEKISAAGPLFTILEALSIFMIMKKRRVTWLYPFLFTCFYMRLLATVISFINANDEARISKALGLGTFTLPMVVNAFLFFLLYHISRLYQLNKRFIVLTLCLVILFSSVIILSNQFLRLTLL